MAKAATKIRSPLDEKFQDFDETEMYNEEEEKKKVLSHKILWDSYADAYISSEDLELIKNYDKKSSDKTELLIKSGADLARIFTVLLAKFQDEMDLRYILTLIDDAVKLKDSAKGGDAPDMIKYFERLRKSVQIDGVPSPMPFGSLTSLLLRKKDDAYIVRKAVGLIGTFALKFQPEAVHQGSVESAMSWCIEQLNNLNAQLQTIHNNIKSSKKKDSDSQKLDKDKLRLVNRLISAISVSLQPLLGQNRYRLVFAKEDGLKPLSKLAEYDDETFSFQRLYESVYLLWLLSFNKQVREHMTEPQLVCNLCYLLKRVKKDKVIRISLATLRNILSIGKNNELMISYGLLKTVEILQSQKFGDDDIEEDLKEIDTILVNNVDDLTNFDRYKAEVLSLKLDWTPPHKSQRFWSENYLKFEEDDRAVLKCLRDIIQASKDSKNLAIACWDLGEFVRFHPRGKAIVQDIDIKTPIMKLLSHEDDTVRKEALTALQKLMVSNWEYFQG
eukprot:TRINITY_DN2933_c0_g1_i1.p1 TRINITY_DN2933_c0_g1~~TRINITY_DN2933_c0_g1_i1.p1  ORF type:complete len:516 (-),score=136.75 TRINITY_DN2933_c0_g1_i1:55-1557(-)